MSNKLKQKKAKQPQFDRIQYEADLEALSNQISEFIRSVPEYEFKTWAAERLSISAVIEGASNAYEGMGIFEAAKMGYMQIWNDASEMDDEEDDTIEYIGHDFGSQIVN